MADISKVINELEAVLLRCYVSQDKNLGLLDSVRKDLIQSLKSSKFYLSDLPDSKKNDLVQTADRLFRSAYVNNEAYKERRQTLRCLSYACLSNDSLQKILYSKMLDFFVGMRDKYQGDFTDEDKLIVRRLVQLSVYLYKYEFA